MNCLLVMPAVSHGAYTDYRGFMNSLCYISAVVKNMDGFNVFTLNLTFADEDYQATMRRIMGDQNIDVVLTGGMSSTYHSIREIISNAKYVNPNVLTIVGGSIITGDPEAAMRALEFADYGVVGEGEETIAELLTVIKDGTGIDGVKGIIARRGEGYVLNAPREPVSDLSAVPWPDYDGFNFEAHLHQEVKFDDSAFNSNRCQAILYLTASRSCPYRCTFCFHAKNDRYRCKKLDDVFDELEYLLNKYPVKSVFLTDEGMGNSGDNHFTQFCDRIKKYNIPWTAFSRVDCLTHEKVQLLKDSGCEIVFLGLESPNNKILDSMNKKITVEQIKSALDMLLDMRMPAIGSFLFCDPAETYESALSSLEWYAAHPQYNIRLGVLCYYPGSEIYWRAVREGKIKDRVEFLKKNDFILNCSQMSDEQYYDIIYNKIPEYTRKRYARLPLLNSPVLTNESGSFRLTGICSACGRQLEFNKVPLFHGYSPGVCKYCATLNALPTYKYDHELVRKNLQYLIAKYGKIAFWGINTLFMNTVDADLVDDDNVHLLDRRCGNMAFNKLVAYPAEIEARDIKFVITPASSALSREISAEAKSYGANAAINLIDFLTVDIACNAEVINNLRPDEDNFCGDVFCG